MEPIKTTEVGDNVISKILGMKCGVVASQRIGRSPFSGL